MNNCDISVETIVKEINDLSFTEINKKNQLLT